MGSKHEYKFLNLAIFFHLTFETVDHKLAIEFGHGASNQLIGVSRVSKLVGSIHGGVDGQRTQHPFPLLCPAISARGLSKVSRGIWYS